MSASMMVYLYGASCFLLGLIWGSFVNDWRKR